jgi:UDP-3-O-[3-hydroxymyristoyl] glucosamine N-acyltransferase
MPDPRFFKTSPAIDLKSLCDRTGAELVDPALSSKMIHDVAPLHTATSDQVSFLDNLKYRDALKTSNAGACFVHESERQYVPAHTVALVTLNPYRSYALAAQYFYPAPKLQAVRASTTVIHPTAKIHDTVAIHDYAVICEGVEIGEGCEIHPHAVIGDHVVIGKNVSVGAHAHVSYAIIGDDVVVYSGCRIGQDGFGFAIDAKGFVKVPQLGRVVIEGHSEIGANTTIDRGALNDTVIGAGTWIDNMVQVAHNVRIGKGCVIAAQVGISGSTEVGNYVMIGGQAGIAGHLKIGDRAKIAAKSGVTRDVPAGEEWMGYPATTMKKYLRQVATLARLTEK